MSNEDRIFIAGHGGMVGSALVRKLRQSGYTNLITRTRAELAGMMLFLNQVICWPKVFTCSTSPAFVAPAFALSRVARVPAARDDLELREQRRQAAHRCRLGRTTLAADQHPAYRRVDGVEHQGRLHPVLADDGAEGVRVPLY